MTLYSFYCVSSVINCTPNCIAPYKYLCAIAGFPSVLPLFHCLFPVRYLSAGNGFRLLACLVARLVACPLCFHIGNGLLVEYDDSSTAYCIVQFLFAKGFACSLKDKYELLSKAKKRSHANCRFAWLLLLFCMLISALSLFYLSFYRNKYQKPDLVRHRAKCREYFSVSSSA